MQSIQLDRLRALFQSLACLECGQISIYCACSSSKLAVSCGCFFGSRHNIFAFTRCFKWELSRASSPGGVESESHLRIPCFLYCAFEPVTCSEALVRILLHMQSASVSAIAPASHNPFSIGAAIYSGGAARLFCPCPAAFTFFISTKWRYLMSFSVCIFEKSSEYTLSIS